MAEAKAKGKTKIFRPEQLAAELKVSGKEIRGWLRQQYPRTAEQRNTAWELDAKQAAAVRKRFTKS